MYERSAIVLERYLDKLFGFNKEYNLRQNFSDFNDLIEELREYQTMVTEEEKVINKFDKIANGIQAIQKLQEKLCLSNQKLEDERNKLFNTLDENPNIVQNRLEKIEKIIEENNEGLKKLREDYIKDLVIFIERQKERNKFARGKRTTEAKHIARMEEADEKFKNISIQDVKNMKRFLNTDKQNIKDAIVSIMIKNGKNEKIGFNKEVINKAVNVKIQIAEKEAEAYIMIYEKLKKLLNEVENDNFNLNEYEKILKDTHVKIAFLSAEEEYIIGFLDNERMTAISGPKIHKKMMEEACQNFDMDIAQINNLYELIIREIEGKATRKSYKDLYNKTYLRDIQQKEKKFEAEVNNIKINLGTVINSNYWRIEGIKNVYDVFQKEVTEKFDKDLSEYKVEEIDILEDIQTVIHQNKYDFKYYDNNDEFDDEYDYSKHNYNNGIDHEDNYDDSDDNYEDEEDYDEDDYEDEYNDNYGEDEDDEYDDDYDEDEDDEYNDDYDEDEDDEYDDDYDEDEDDEYDDDDKDEDDEYNDDDDDNNSYDEDNAFNNETEKYYKKNKNKNKKYETIRNINYNIRLDAPYEEYQEEQQELLYKFPKVNNNKTVSKSNDDNYNSSNKNVSTTINRPKRRTRKRHEKDIYSFNDTSNIFDKLFKKKDNY